MGASKRAKADGAPVVTTDRTAADKLAEVMIDKGVPAEVAPDVDPPEIPVLGVVGEIFPFGAVVRREDGTRLKPGDVIRAGERMSVSTIAAESPPMGFTIIARIL